MVPLTLTMLPQLKTFSAKISKLGVPVSRWTSLIQPETHNFQQCEGTFVIDIKLRFDDKGQLISE